VTTTRVRLLAAIDVAAGVAFLAYILAFGLDTTGRHLFVLSLARLAFLAGLGAFLLTTGLSGGLARTGFGLAAAGALLNLAGAVGHVATDGWSYNPFDGQRATAPWYAYVIGISALLFFIGTVVVAIAALRSTVARPLAVAVLLAGVSFLLAGPFVVPGHFVWTVAWVALGILVIRAHRESVAPDG